MSAPYDFIFIDTQPSASNLALSATYACDQVIVPIPVARKGLDALLGTHQVVRSLGRHIPGFEVLLYLPTQYQAGLRDAQEHLEQIRAQLPHLAPVLSHRPGVYNGAHTEGMTAPTTKRGEKYRLWCATCSSASATSLHPRSRTHD